MSRKRYAVLGLGQFGRSLAEELCEAGCEVLAVDRNPKLVENIRDRVTSAAVADVKDPAALGELVNDTFDGAIVAMGDSLESCILATLQLKEIGVPMIYAEASDPQRAEVLTRIGATKVISPERDYGRRLARGLAGHDLIDFVPLTVGYGVCEMVAPDWCVGKSLAELNLRRERQLAVIAIRDLKGRVTVVPGADTKIAADDQLTIIGQDTDLAKFR